jgi:glutamate/tyrosine decarboxylase-like PLP-dependent enzyme
VTVAGSDRQSNCDIRYHVQLAQEFAGWVRAARDREVAAPHPLSLVCFRWARTGTGEAERETLNARAWELLQAAATRTMAGATPTSA